MPLNKITLYLFLLCIYHTITLIQKMLPKLDIGFGQHLRVLGELVICKKEQKKKRIKKENTNPKIFSRAESLFPFTFAVPKRAVGSFECTLREIQSSPEVNMNVSIT